MRPARLGPAADVPAAQALISRPRLTPIGRGRVLLPYEVGERYTEHVGERGTFSVSRSRAAQGRRVRASATTVTVGAHLRAARRRVIRPFAEWSVLREARREAAQGRYSANSASANRNDVRPRSDRSCQPPFPVLTVPTAWLSTKSRARRAACSRASKVMPCRVRGRITRRAPGISDAMSSAT